MNEFTKTIVIETALQNKAAARANDERFRHQVCCNHQHKLIYLYGWKLKQRAVDLFRLWHPEIYDGEFIQEDYKFGFDIDVKLSELTMRCLWRKVEREPELQLHYDWGDLPKLTVEPQLALF